MVVYGWGRQTKKYHGPTLPVKCPNCGNKTWLYLLSVRTWGSIYWIPFWPYSTTGFLVCPICSNGLELSAYQMGGAYRLNKMAIKFLAGTVSEADYLDECEGTRLLPNLEIVAGIPLDRGFYIEGAKP